MTLPTVNGWLIDLRTARAIFNSGNNQRISHCVEKCSTGDLHYCHSEHAFFREDALLKGPFTEDNDCQCMPDTEVMTRCASMASAEIAKKLLKGNNAALFIAATASVRGYGVISDHRNLVFHTVYDLCTHFGVPVLKADEYFALL